MQLLDNPRTFKLVICKLCKHKLRDGGYSLSDDAVQIIETGEYYSQYFKSFDKGKVIRYEDKFYAVLEKGCRSGGSSKIQGHYVKLIPISISKYVGELIIGDVWHA